MQKLLDEVMFALFDQIVADGEMKMGTVELFAESVGASRAEIRLALRMLLKQRALVQIILKNEVFYTVPPEHQERVMTLLVGGRVD